MAYWFPLEECPPPERDGQKDVKKWSKGGQIDYRDLGKIIKLLVINTNILNLGSIYIQIKSRFGLMKSHQN